MAKHLVCSPVKSVYITPHSSIIKDRHLCLSTIYLTFTNYPLWVDEEGPTENGWAIIHHLKNSYQHGLTPQNYGIDRIQELLHSQDNDDLAELETLLSFGLVRYIYDIYGENDDSIFPADKTETAENTGAQEFFDPVAAIHSSLEAKDLYTFLAERAPSHYHYKGLQKALDHYRSIAAAGGWLTIPDGPPLRPGDIDPRIKAVKLRLLKTDWPANKQIEELDAHYDETLKQAVIRFQKRYHLAVDGIIGKQTLHAMNIPVQDLIDTIRMNMTRWHRQAHKLGQNYVIVNIADFTLKGVNDNEVILDIPVVVGTRQNQTPVFSDHIKYLVFNPYWTIPPTIARNEELPSLRKNPKHLVERHVRLFSSWFEDAIELDSTTIDWHQVSRQQISAFRLRQDPGPWNSLGKLKFVFPNKYSVYMHDTPAQDLFSRDNRNFSHGCIRVSDPPALAAFIFKRQNEKFTDERLNDLYSQPDRIALPLPNPVPVHITYQTSWVDKDGLIHFNRDVYARDAKMLHAAN